MQSCPYYLVTPSRVCELKWLLCRYWRFVPRHTLTGVWVEMNQQCYIKKLFLSHPHGCVSWNDISAVVIYLHIGVTPSRVCELKSTNIANRSCAIMSHPHGCVSWNNVISTFWNDLVLSHPHGCVSWNSHQLWYLLFWYRSHPHGCVSWNKQRVKHIINLICHTLTGVWVEILDYLTTKWCHCHTLTGVWVEIVVIWDSCTGGV